MGKLCLRRSVASSCAPSSGKAACLYFHRSCPPHQDRPEYRTAIPGDTVSLSSCTVRPGSALPHAVAQGGRGCPVAPPYLSSMSHGLARLWALERFSHRALKTVGKVPISAIWWRVPRHPVTFQQATRPPIPGVEAGRDQSRSIGAKTWKFSGCALVPRLKPQPGTSCVGSVREEKVAGNVPENLPKPATSRLGLGGGVGILSDIHVCMTLLTPSHSTP